MKGKYTKSKKAIRDTFINLIDEKDINKVTVSEIARAADVSRGTFYLHYKDVDDLYTDIEDEMYGRLAELFNDYYQSKELLDLESLIPAIINFIYDNKETFSVITKPINIDRTLRRLRNFCLKRMVFPHIKELGLPYQETRAIFISNGFVGVLSEWILSDMKIEKKDLIYSLKEIIKQIR